MKKHGFTLVELVVVLAVIAILTHLAVRELSHLRDAKLTKAADAPLETIRTSVFTPSGMKRRPDFLQIWAGCLVSWTT